MKKPFIIEDWLPVEEITGKSVGPEAALKASTTAPGGSFTKTDAENRQAVERALEALETARVDLTSSYKNWLEIGFAFADAFGESGREYFQRASQFHPEYNRQDCDKQYDHCLRSTGSGITLSSFFHHLKASSLEMFRHAVPPVIPPSLPGAEESYWDSHEAPKDFSEPMAPLVFGNQEKQISVKDADQLPCFPDEIFPKLPELLQQAVASADNREERDILLLGSLGVLSACFPNVFGIYKGLRVGTNLFLFVTAPASAGKGRLTLCKKLGMPIHKTKLAETEAAQEEYEQRLADYNMNKSGERPRAPSLKLLFIPANNSSTGMIQMLADNKGQGILFETEADTLSQNLKKDFGDYSDVLRKGFQNEGISYFRRTEREYVDIEDPRLSVVLSGTPQQVASLIPGSENGLFSRFMFYFINTEPEWVDVWKENSEYELQEHYDYLGAEFYNLHQQIRKRDKIRIHLDEAKHELFNKHFDATLKQYKALNGVEYVATVKRMGVMCYRIAMLLTLLRLKQGEEIPANLHCSEEDYETAIKMINCLNRHSSFVFRILPKQVDLKLQKIPHRNFLEALPREFNRQDYLGLAKKMHIPAKTAEKAIDRALTAGILGKIAHNHYEVKLKVGEL